MTAPSHGPAEPHADHDSADTRFDAPWEATVFALVARLHERGVMTWSEWTAALAAELARPLVGEIAGSPTSPYTAWLSALEALLADKAVASRDEQQRYVEAWRRAAARTLHGRPITLDTEFV